MVGSLSAYDTILELIATTKAVLRVIGIIFFLSYLIDKIVYLPPRSVPILRINPIPTVTIANTPSIISVSITPLI